MDGGLEAVTDRFRKVSHDFDGPRKSHRPTGRHSAAGGSPSAYPPVNLPHVLLFRRCLVMDVSNEWGFSLIGKGLRGARGRSAAGGRRGDVPKDQRRPGRPPGPRPPPLPRRRGYGEGRGGVASVPVMTLGSQAGHRSGFWAVPETRTSVFVPIGIVRKGGVEE